MTDLINVPAVKPSLSMRGDVCKPAYSPPVRCGAVITILFALFTTPLAAQTLFQWPSTPVDVAKYKMPEQCLSLIHRLDNAVIFTNDGPDQDTLALSLPEVQSLPDTSIIHAATRCAAMYPPEKVASYDLIPIMQLYLMAGRDADANTLATRILASGTADDETRRVDILIDIIREYVNTQPARLSAVTPFLGMIAEGSAEIGLRQRLGAFHTFLNAARRAQDTMRIRYAANTLLQLAHRAPKRLMGAQEDGYVLTALEALATDTLLNSLRQSTAAYVAIHKGLQKQANATRAIGEIAPPLEGDYWFVSTGTGGPSRLAAPPIHPTRGKVAVVVFLEPWRTPNINPPNYDGVGRDVRGSLAAARRLSSRYPDLDVTAVTETHGAFQRIEPPTPDAEADTLQNYWLKFWRMPGTLTIQRTPFTRLPDPDRRVIEQNIPNIENYNFGVRHAATRMWTFIVDRDGTIVWYGNMDRETEAEMDQIIGILMRRDA